MERNHIISWHNCIHCQPKCHIGGRAHTHDHRRRVRIHDSTRLMISARRTRTHTCTPNGMRQLCTIRWLTLSTTLWAIDLQVEQQRSVCARAEAHQSQSRRSTVYARTTLERAWRQDVKPGAAMCVQDVDAQCVCNSH